jgi:uncharacterized protein (TIGR02598 family)
MRLNLPLNESHSGALNLFSSGGAGSGNKGSVKHRGAGGFTLVEIALAMAIFSFALVSMLGLLSVGLKNSRKASIQIAAANVLSTIAADLQSSQISNVSNGEYTATSQKLKIKALVMANGATQITYPAPLIVDEACTPVNPSDSQGLVKTFRVILSAAEPSVRAVRVQIQWPSTTPESAQPEGSLNSLVALPFP